MMVIDFDNKRPFAINEVSLCSVTRALEKSETLHEYVIALYTGKHYLDMSISMDDFAIANQTVFFQQMTELIIIYKLIPNFLALPNGRELCDCSLCQKFIKKMQEEGLLPPKKIVEKYRNWCIMCLNSKNKVVGFDDRDDKLRNDVEQRRKVMGRQFYSEESIMRYLLVRGANAEYWEDGRRSLQPIFIDLAVKSKSMFYFLEKYFTFGAKRMSAEAGDGSGYKAPSLESMCNLWPWLARVTAEIFVRNGLFVKFGEFTDNKRAGCGHDTRIGFCGGCREALGILTKHNLLMTPNEYAEYGGQILAKDDRSLELINFETGRYAKKINQAEEVPVDLSNFPSHWLLPVSVRRSDGRRIEGGERYYPLGHDPRHPVYLPRQRRQVSTHGCCQDCHQYFMVDSYDQQGEEVMPVSKNQLEFMMGDFLFKALPIKGGGSYEKDGYFRVVFWCSTCVQKRRSSDECSELRQKSEKAYPGYLSSYRSEYVRSRYGERVGNLGSGQTLEDFRVERFKADNPVSVENPLDKARKEEQQRRFSFCLSLAACDAASRDRNSMTSRLAQKVFSGVGKWPSEYTAEDWLEFERINNRSSVMDYLNSVDK